jgi:hypothetical protein
MGSDEKMKWPIVLEDVAILLSVLVLWPTILGWQGPGFRALQLIALACLAAILVRRIRRVKRKSEG